MADIFTIKPMPFVDGELGIDTLLVHAGQVPDPTTGAILAPVIQSTTYVQESVEKYQASGYTYSRTANPTVAALERKIAALENGYGAIAFATGMAATITTMTAFLKSGDHCVLTNCSYGGTNRLCRVVLSEFGITFTFVDFTDLNAIRAAIQENTKMLLSETPANPTVTLNDLAAISALAKEKGLIHVCDTTFATPIITRGIDFGVDIVLQSTTKYYDGHNMTVGGAAIANNKELYDRLRFMCNVHGNLMAPWTAFLQLQTMKTMSLRVEKQSKTAQAIAEFLEKHPKVDKVSYPGLKSHPQHDLALKQHKNGLHGGMLWFEVKGGTESGRKLMNTIKRPWSLCENLGATESIITCPSVMTHANMTQEDRLKVGITDGFVRVSSGIEDADDLIRALDEALSGL